MFRYALDVLKKFVAQINVDERLLMAAYSTCRLKSQTPKSAQLLEGYESSAFFIPKHQTQALQASQQRNSAVIY